MKLSTKASVGWIAVSVLLVATVVLAGLNGLRPGFIDKMISALYESNPNVVDSGGGKAASANYMTVASIGQPAVGEATSSMYKNEAGFFTTDEVAEDGDGDGVPNDEDNCPTVPNPDQTDSDSDDVGNACDNCPDVANSDQTDWDADDVGNMCDNCPGVANPGQEDDDADNFGNVCDNCPDISNPSQTDNDSDNIGNACDNCRDVVNADQTDTDGDCPAPPYTSDPECGDACAGCLRGDVNCDGTITPGDALCAFWRSILGSFQAECLCECSEQSAEINCDGNITPGDALCIFWRAILGDWTEECQCPTAKAVAPNQAVDIITVQSVQGTPAEEVKVSISVENPNQLDAFALQFSYPSNLLAFDKVVAAPSTEKWIALEGRMTDEGSVMIGGFNFEALSLKGSVVIAEVIFTTREGISGHGQFDLTNLTDDLAGAPVHKGTLTVREIPKAFGLFQNYPNPFNPTTTIHYTIPSTEQRAGSGEGRNNSELCALRTTLKIYNILGQEVKTLLDQVQKAGYYTVAWDGRDRLGQEVPSGVYFYRLRAGDFSETRRMLLMK